MAVDFEIPKLGDNVSEATIVSWLVDDGAEVSEGDEVLEVETDKAVVPIPANASGILRIGSFGAGDTIKISEVVATIETNGDSGSADKAQAAEKTEATAAQASGEAKTEAKTETAVATAEPETSVKVTPVAQKMAADMGVDLTSINGSGAHGKITKDDVLQAASGDEQPAKAKPAPEPEVRPEPKPAAKAEPEKAKPAAKPAAAPQPAFQPTSFPATPEEDVLERIPLKGIRGVIARRMAESVHTTARVTLLTEVDATEFVNLREQLKARYAGEWGFAPGYNDLLAMIVASGLGEFPYMNARFSSDGESVEYLKPIHMGMAVDTDRGLLVPVIKNLDKKGLKEIGSEFRELVKKARSGKASPSELSGSTFTITSLGTFRVDAFTPVINIPEAAILGVGRIKEKPVAKDGDVVIRSMLTLSLVFDHRLTDGAPAARFLDYVCDLIEDPQMLFLTRR